MANRATPSAPKSSGPASAESHPLAPLDSFARRHLGLSDTDRQAMLGVIGVASMDKLIDQTVPSDIRLDGPLQLAGLDNAQPLGESAALAKLRGYADLNQPMISMIGMGYHNTVTPPVILRNVLENPNWYTPYTPYQAEISQGRLEGLLNFQTVVSDLTGLPLAGASLLDEATAAAEAMAMCFNVARQKKPKFFVAEDCHPQTIAVVKTRASGLGIEVVVGKAEGWPSLGSTSNPASTNSTSNSTATNTPPQDFCGILLQYPATDGRLEDYAALTAQAHEHGTLVVAATDLLACCLITPPGEWGADIAVGSAQRFGVPMGYGGPHAAFLATREKYARKMPGRLIGVSKDVSGNVALRMAIQTREQHIKRDKATSNICTAQALLANIAGFYAVYHGPEGLKAIARRVHDLARHLAGRLAWLGFSPISDHYFDTVSVRLEKSQAHAIVKAAAEAGFNLRRIGSETLSISLDETTTHNDLDQLLAVFCEASTSTTKPSDSQPSALPQKLTRTSHFLVHPVFNQYHTEHEMMRYLQRLVSRDYGLSHGMIPLGSCTMKLNAAAEMIPITWPGFADLHPYCPDDQARGYAKLFNDLESWLAEITGFAAVSLQPNAGSQGEYAGLMAIRAYHQTNQKLEAASQKSQAQDKQPVSPASEPPASDSALPASRNICLIPTSAHGTNPASAVIAGMAVVPVACQPNGDIDLDDLTSKAKRHADQLACLMITYPSTHGVFEDTVRQACDLIHQHGGQVYMDGANMNAQVGLTSPGKIGADVCHLNLHKTFCIPHGGGGPGMGPIGVAAHLAPFLPSNPLGHPEVKRLNPKTSNSPPSPLAPELPTSHFPLPISPTAVSAAPYGSPMILPISWMYIAMMGAAGLKQATEHAILNANYMAAKLRPHYNILYTGTSGTVAHEFIVDVRPFDKSAGVTVDDFAKRLMDYGFHAPTMSWPVAGTLMIEPTESESKAELDRFCDAMISIRAEVARIEEGQWTQDDNPLKGAPHTAEYVTADDWPHAYSREVAAYPVSGLKTSEGGAKFWPAVGRIDNPYGDRHLVCTCPPMSAFGDSE